MVIYGGRLYECIDDVNNKVMLNFEMLVNRQQYKRLTWAGRVIDPKRMIQIKQVKKNFDPNFVEDDPSIISQDKNWKWYVGDGLLEWDGRFDGMYNFDEDGGGVYGCSDDEEYPFHLDCFIEKTERMTRRLKRKKD